MAANFPELLRISRGVTAVVGSGGKTTLLAAISEQLPGTVLLCASTHIRPFAKMPVYTDSDIDALARLAHDRRVVCVGAPAADGKLTAPDIPFARLADIADYVLVEADGAKMRPLKAHAPYEPVIPDCNGRTLCVVGGMGFDQPIKDAVHRPEIFCNLTGASMDAPATPELVARCVLREGLADTVFVNQADTPALMKKAEDFAAHLPEGAFTVYAGALSHGRCALL